MDLTLHVWRQKSAKDKGRIEVYKAKDVSPHSSFLEMLDQVNESLTREGIEPIAYDHDCREGICGTCSTTINGIPHGPEAGVTTCQLHMRNFKDGDQIFIEPFRARAFPIVKDLVVDRSALDRIMQAGGFVSVNTGGTPDANSILIGKDSADKARDASQCIGCGACVAACKNASAMLFDGAKVAHFNRLPQGQPERNHRVKNMVAAMDKEGFGCCTNYYECCAVCPKEITKDVIATMNSDHLKANLKGE